MMGCLCLIFIVGLAMLGAGLQLRIQPSSEAPTNTAVIGVPKLEEDSYDWYARHAEILRVQRTIDPELVLIGDSITHFWGGEPKASLANGPASFASLFGEHRVLNLGFGWDRTQNVLWRLDHGELEGLQPKAVVILIGTNNTSDTANARANTASEIAAGIAAICARVRTKVGAECRMVLLQILPREASLHDPRRELIAATNSLLVGVAAACGATLVDAAPHLLLPDGSLPQSLAPDFCHPNEDGCAIGRMHTDCVLLRPSNFNR